MGMLRRPRLVTVLAFVTLLIALLTPAAVAERFDAMLLHPGLWFGQFTTAFAFFGLFLSAAAYYLWR